MYYWFIPSQVGCAGVCSMLIGEYPMGKGLQDRGILAVDLDVRRDKLHFLVLVPHNENLKLILPSRIL